MMKPAGQPATYDAPRTTYDILAERGIFPDSDHPYTPKRRYRYRCPFHDDHDPSFDLHEDRNQWYCHPCGMGGGPGKLLELLGEGYTAPPRPASESAKKGKTKAKWQKPAGCTLAQLAPAKGLPIEHLRALGWYDTDWYGTPAVAIPYANGSLRYRTALEGKDRFRWRKGDKPDLYGVERLEEYRKIGWVLMIEGETDYATGLLMGLPVIGAPGADAWKSKWASLFQGLAIYVWKEPDMGGKTLTTKLAMSFREIHIIDAPPGVKDICELNQTAGDRAREIFDDLRKQAKVWPEPEAPDHQDDENLVRNKVYSSINLKTDKTLLRPNPRWDFCCQTFPDPIGVKPWTRSHLLFSEQDKRGLACDLRANTWFNPANAAFKKRKFLFHGMRKLSWFDELYWKEIPIDDWAESTHEAIRKSIARADGLYLAFDNVKSAGSWVFLSTVPQDDFEPINDLETFLIRVLKGIQPPKRSKSSGRFCPIRGSQILTRGCDAPVDNNRKRYQVVAESPKPTDFAVMEVEVGTAGIEYEFMPSVFRAQAGPTFSFKARSIDEVRALAVHLGGYTLRRARVAAGAS
jgi:hypothetical protein